jgi:hypothetical protein
MWRRDNLKGVTYNSAGPIFNNYNDNTTSDTMSSIREELNVRLISTPRLEHHDYLRLLSFR